jgi:hydroxymethylbilane synthase
MQNSVQKPLRIGTRGSALALVQARLAVARLKAAHTGLPEPEVIVIKTTGDRVQDRPLAELGGKGLFAKEIEQALLAGTIDCAVHSLKDLETHLPAGLVIGAVLARADPRDALIAPGAKSLADLPEGASIATGSIRRAAQLRALRPDLAIGPMRGNVDTRLAKIRGGAAAATLLAMAGLERLALSVPEATPLDPDVILPAPGQGLVAIECRERDARVRALLAACADPAATAAMAAERALLAGLDGSCKTPIGALAETLPNGALRLRALLAREDGTLLLRAGRLGAPSDAAAMGADAAADLRARAPDDLLAA